jgi:lysophospholipase L1-like esterase
VKAKHALVSVGTLLLAIVVPELALRAAGFRFAPGMEFGWPRPQELVQFAPDDKLLWKLRTADDPAPKKWSGNALGLPGEEVVLPKPQGVYRVIFLGDSCTFLDYPEFTMRDLESSKKDGTKYDDAILAIPGYSSYQGLVLAEEYGRHDQGDVVIVYYGWNDHWKAYGAIDSQKRVHVSESFAGRMLARATRDSRLLQAMNWLRSRTSSTGKPIDALRVPIDEYEHNLKEIERTFREVGTSVVFVTAPTSHYALGVPPYLLLLHFVDSAESAIKLHRAYNDVVRKVAKETGSVLLDLEAEAEKRSDLGTLFTGDGIHFTDAGKAWIGELVAQCIREHEPVHAPR